MKRKLFTGALLTTVVVGAALFSNAQSKSNKLAVNAGPLNGTTCNIEVQCSPTTGTACRVDQDNPASAQLYLSNGSICSVFLAYTPE